MFDLVSDPNNYIFTMDQRAKSTFILRKSHARTS